MRRKLLFISLFVIFLSPSFAETIQLKSGQKAEGTIIEKLENYYIVRLNDGKVETYMTGDIQTIDGKKINPVEGPKPEDAINKEDQNTQAADPAATNTLPFSTAIITYKYTGSHQGKETVYIDAVNNRCTQESQTRGHLFGEVLSKAEMNICSDNMFYSIDLEKSRGAKEEWKGKCIAAIFKENQYLDYYSGTASFLGKVCKVYKQTAGVLYFWNGIILKEIVSKHPMGEDFNYTKEAVDIQLDTVIPPDKFKVPVGIKLMTGEELMREMKKMFEQMKPKCNR